MNKLLLGAGVLAAAAALAYKSEAADNVPQTYPHPDEAEDAEYEIILEEAPTEKGTAISRVGAPKISKEEFIALKKSDWRRMLKEQMDSQPLAMAANTLWEMWNTDENPLRGMYNSSLSFLLSLIVVQPPAVGDAGEITWNSWPVFPTWDNYFDDPNKIWSCGQWKIWHRKLEERYNSTRIANDIWEQKWVSPLNSRDYLGGLEDLLLPFVATANDCKFDCDFAEYLYSKDIDVSSLLSGTWCSLSGVVKNIVGSVEDISYGISNTAKVARYVMPAAVIGATAYLLYRTRNVDLSKAINKKLL